MRQRISVPLESADLQALVLMAQADCRHPRHEMLWLLRQEATRRGLLAAGAQQAEREQGQRAEEGKQDGQ